MKKAILLAFFSLSLTTTAQAELLVNPASSAGKNNPQFSAFFKNSSVKMDVENVGSGDVDRTIIGASAAYGITDNADAYFAFGLANDVDYEDLGDGDGTQFGFGIRGKLPLENQLTLKGYAQFTSYKEETTENGVDIEGSGNDIRGGIVAASDRGDFVIYGGIDMILSESFEIEAGGVSADVEHDSSFGFLVGGELSGSMPLHFQAMFGHETGFLISASF